MSVRQTAGDGSFTLAGSARPPGSATGRGLVCSGTGAAGRTGPTRPFRLAGRGAAPLVAERADEVQSAASLVEGAGRSRRRSGLARVGDRARHAGPGLEQAEPDRPPRPGIAGPGQGMPQRVGHDLRHHDRDVRARRDALGNVFEAGPRASGIAAPRNPAARRAAPGLSHGPGSQRGGAETVA